MRRILDALREFPPALALLLAVAAVMALSWNFATAPLQGPDEPEHAAYVDHLAESGSLPSKSGDGSPLTREVLDAKARLGLSALVQNRSARPDWSTVRLAGFEKFEGSLGANVRGEGGEGLSTASNPPLYYVLGSIPWKLTPGGHLLDRLFLLRLLSALFLVIAVAGTWLLAGEIFRRRLPQATAAAFIALLPIAGFLGGTVSPDTATAAIWALLLWLAVRMGRKGPTPEAVALTSLAATLAVLIHGRNLVALPVLAIALVAAWVTNRTRPREIAIGAAITGAIVGAGALIYRTAASSGGGGLYGGETSLGEGSAFNLRQLASSIWQFYLPKLSTMEPRIGPPVGFRQVFIEQFLGGTFASNEVYMPYWVYDWVQVLFVVALVAFYTIVVLRWRTVMDRWPAALVVGSAAVGLLLFLHLASYRALVNGSDNPLITGRYLIPLAAPLGLVAATIVAGIPRRASAALAGFMAGGLFCLSLSAIFLSLERFYA